MLCDIIGKSESAVCLADERRVSIVDILIHRIGRAMIL